MSQKIEFPNYMDEEHVKFLEASRKSLGEIYPVIMSGKEVIDGYHRLKAYKDWKVVNIGPKPELDKILLRLVLNHRRDVSAKETRELFNRAAELLSKEGYGPGQISKIISEKTGFSREYVLKHLQKKYKLPAPPKPPKAPKIPVEKKPPVEVKPPEVPKEKPPEIPKEVKVPVEKVPKEVGIEVMRIRLPRDIEERVTRYAKDSNMSIEDALVFLLDMALRTVGY